MCTPTAVAAFTMPGFVRTMRSRNSGVETDPYWVFAPMPTPPTTTSALGFTERIASAVSMNMIAYPSGSTLGHQVPAVLGAFHTSHRRIGWGVTPGWALQNVPPGPYRCASAFAPAAYWTG